jgi:hypothetical protein
MATNKLGQLSFVHAQRRSKMLKGRKIVLPKVFQSINVDEFILTPTNVVELFFITNYNIRFRELDFFNSSFCKC